VAFDTTPALNSYREQVAIVHKTCTLRLYRALKDCGLAVPEPKGAFYVYPSFHPYTKQLEVLGIKTSAQLSYWLIEECGIAALPGEVFGEDDEGARGGRYRLRMSTSNLYFRDQKERYARGYDLLSQSAESLEHLRLEVLDEAVEAIRKAVAKLEAQ
jgi:aspartate aminotransferase